MARIRGVFLRDVPKGPSSYTSKEAALIANPEMVVADAVFPKGKMESAKNAAFRVNSGGREEYGSDEFFAIWEYAKDVVLRVNPGSGERSVEFLGFERDGEVIGEDGKSIGKAETVLARENVERGGWVLLIGLQPHVPEGWSETVNGPGSGRRRRRRTKGSEES